jgi:hypothetical protein
MVLVLMVAIMVVIVVIAMKTPIGPWAMFLAVLAAAGLYLLLVQNVEQMSR